MCKDELPRIIGLWRERGSLRGCHPSRLISSTWDAKKRQCVIQYLRSGLELGGYLGYSWCRFRCGIPDEQMGSRDLTDGLWVWPEGLVHYVEAHGIILPDDFVSHAEDNQWKIAGTSTGIGRLDQGVDTSYWEQWCAGYSWWRKLLRCTKP